MTDLETRLRGVELAEPPLGFDPDEVADRAARQARTRAAGIGGTLVALAVVVAAFLFAPVPDPAPPAAGPVPPSLAEQARIRQALTDAVTRLFPGLRHLSVGTSQADAISPAQMSVSAEFVDATGRAGWFQLTVRGPKAKPSVLAPGQPCTGTHCRGVPQPGGGVLDPDGALYRPDGSTVTIIEGIGFSLTQEQLTKVITDPAFVLP